MSILWTNLLKKTQTKTQVPYKKPNNPSPNLSRSVVPTSSWKEQGYFKESGSMENLYSQELGSLRSVLNTDTVGGFDFGRQLRFCTWQVEWLKCSQNANLENKPQTFLHMALDTDYSLYCLFVSKNT